MWGRSRDLDDICADNWRDLCDGDMVVIMPAADFEAIIEATRGQPVLPHRHCVYIEFKGQRNQRPERLTFWQRVGKIFWGEWR